MKNSWFLSRWGACVAVAVLAVPLTFAQTQGGGSSGGGGGGGSAGGSTGGRTGGSRPPSTQPGRTQSPTQMPSSTERQQPTFPEMQRPIFLQGKVMFADGTPAPPNIVIERVCTGRRIPEGYTDSKGRFSFEVGKNQQFIADASVSGFGNARNPNDPFGNRGSSPGSPGRGITERDLAGCELRAQLPGYRSTSVELTGHRVFDNPNVGTLVLRKIGNVSGFTISSTSLQAPKKAKKAFSNGVKNAKKKKWTKAQTEFEKAVELHPDYAEAWYHLGQIYSIQKQPEKAREAYNKSVSSDAKYVNPYLKLAMMDAQNSRWPEVAKTTDNVIKMNPYDFPDAYFLNAMASLNLNDLPQAEKSAREAIKMNVWRKYPQIEQILGLSLAFQNKLPEAKVHLEKYLELSPNARNAPVVRQQLEKMNTILAQQGGGTPAESGAPAPSAKKQ